MHDDKKIVIGNFEYLICKNENGKYYLYRYDVEHETKIKITFNDDKNNVKDEIIKILSKEYIEKIIKAKSN